MRTPQSCLMLVPTQQWPIVARTATVLPTSFITARLSSFPAYKTRPCLFPEANQRKRVFSSLSLSLLVCVAERRVQAIATVRSLFMADTKPLQSWQRRRTITFDLVRPASGFTLIRRLPCQNLVCSHRMIFSLFQKLFEPRYGPE